MLFPRQPLRSLTGIDTRCRGTDGCLRNLSRQHIQAPHVAVLVQTKHTIRIGRGKTEHSRTTVTDHHRQGDRSERSVPVLVSRSFAHNLPTTPRDGTTSALISLSTSAWIRAVLAHVLRKGQNFGPKPLPRPAFPFPSRIPLSDLNR